VGSMFRSSGLDASGYAATSPKSLSTSSEHPGPPPSRVTMSSMLPHRMAFEARPRSRVLAPVPSRQLTGSLYA
jgi:hypothetical protein